MEHQQLLQQVQQQQAQQQQLQEQITFLHQQLNEQKLKVQNIKVTKFDLTADQIIRNFNEIQSFSGEDNYKLQSFLKAINDAEDLCGENNEDLKHYCLRKIVNSKIIGGARNIILEIPEHLRTWTNVVEQLRTKYRPKNTIHQLLFQARDIKVINLKDLFNKLNIVKSKCSELCDFNNEDLFTYESIDKELLQILKSKLVPLVQLQIDMNKTLYELDNVLCQTEIYSSEEIIKPEFRINRNKNSFSNKKFDNNFSNGNNNFKKPNENLHNYNKPNYYNYNSNRNQNNHNNNNNNNLGHNLGQFKRQFDNRNRNFNYQNRSGQFNTNSGQNRQYYNKYNNRQPEAMEVDNINSVNSLNHEVNFIEEPQETNYP